jgi:hypothetical protein
MLFYALRLALTVNWNHHTVAQEIGMCYALNELAT